MVLLTILEAQLTSDAFKIEMEVVFYNLEDMNWDMNWDKSGLLTLPTTGDNKDLNSYRLLSKSYTEKLRKATKAEISEIDVF